MHRRTLLAGLAAAPLGAAATARQTAGRYALEPTSKARSGRAVAWEHRFDGENAVRAQRRYRRVRYGLPLAADDDLVAVGGEQLVGLDPDSGTQRWTRGDLGGAGAATLGNQSLYLLDSDGTLRALDRSSGTTRWSHSALARDSDGVVAPPRLLDGRVVVCDENWIGAADRGGVAWERTFDASISGLTVGEGTVFATAGSIVVALDPATGEEHWRADLGRRDRMELLVAPTAVGGRVVTVGLDGTVYGVADGEVVWNRPLVGRANVVERAATVPSSDRIVVLRTTFNEAANSRTKPYDSYASIDARLVVTAHDPSGAVAWTLTERYVPDYNLREPIGELVVDNPRFVPPAAERGVVFLPAYHRVIAVDAASGARRGRWTYPSGYHGEGLAAVAHAGSTLLLAGTEELVALEPSTCEPPSVESVAVEHVAPRPEPWQLEVDVDVAGAECPSLVSVSLRHGGELLSSGSEVVRPDDEAWTVGAKYATSDFPENETATVRVRGSDGTVIEERTVDVVYREDPGSDHQETPVWPTAILAGLGGGVLARALLADGGGSQPDDEES